MDADDFYIIFQFMHYDQQFELLE